MTALVLAVFLAWSQVEPVPAGGGAAEFALGNSAFRNGRYAEAVLQYERALLRRAGDRNVAHNLRLAREALGLAPAGPAWCDVALQHLGAERLMPGVPDGVAAAFLAGLAGVLALLCCGASARGRRLRAAIFAVWLAATLAGGAVVLCRMRPVPPRAVVREQPAEIRAAPHASRPVLARAAPGSTLVVFERSDRWARVAWDGGAGWVRVEQLGLVE